MGTLRGEGSSTFGDSGGHSPAQPDSALQWVFLDPELALSHLHF